MTAFDWYDGKFDQATVDAFDDLLNGHRPDDSWVREPPAEFVSSEPPSLRADEWTNLRQAPPRLVFRTAREVVESAPEQVPWVACPWLASGAVTELDGKIKAGGKTTFVAAMVRAVVTGAEFMGRPTMQGPVVYLTEQPDTTFSLALTRAGLADRDDVHILSWKDTRQTNWPLVVALAAEKANKVGAVMLVVDTLPQFAGLAGDAENNAGAALASMTPLQVAAAEGLAVLIIRHDRKSGGDVGDSARGSSAFGGAVDVVLSIRRADGNRPNTRVIHALSRFDETPVAAVVELRRSDPSEHSSAPDEYVMLDDNGAPTTEMVTAAVIKELPASEAGAVTADDLADAVDGARTTVFDVLKALHKAGEVARTGAGKKGDPYRWWIRPENSSAYRGGGSDETNSEGPLPLFTDDQPSDDSREMWR